jgi:hypothetical protein
MGDEAAVEVLSLISAGWRKYLTEFVPPVRQPPARTSPGRKRRCGCLPPERVGCDPV